MQIHVVTEGDNNLLDLLSKLTGGSKDKRLTFTEFGIEFGESTNGEGGGFTLIVEEEKRSRRSGDTGIKITKVFVLFKM
jgi:hypothetical protein